MGPRLGDGQGSDKTGHQIAAVPSPASLEVGVLGIRFGCHLEMGRSAEGTNAQVLGSLHTAPQ